MNGYDIDGVLVPQKVTPIHPYIVISGRKIHEWQHTIAQLREYIGEQPPATYLRPTGRDGDPVSAAVWKSAIINLAGVTTFYEDDPTQAAIIRSRCPACLVHLVT
jgi:hypothetical protein